MFKKILSLALCLVMCLSIALTATSCGEASTATATGDVPATFTLLGITGETTTQEYVDMVEKAINDILAPRYKSKIELMLVTEDEYLALVEEQQSITKHSTLLLLHTILMLKNSPLPATIPKKLSVTG